MLDQILTPIFCIGLPFLLIVAAAIIGTNRRIKLANKIIVGIKEGKFQDFSTSRVATRIRLLSLLAFISTIGVFLIAVLVITKKLTGNSIGVIILFVVFIITSIFLGKLLLGEVIDRLK